MSSPVDKPVRYGLDECLNCGSSLGSERYCPNCGQLNTDRIISIWALIGDFLRDYFSFDSKFFRTTIPLMIRPGSVPREFLEGKRVRHIPPLRMLIFSSFVMFLVWGWTYDSEESVFGYVGQEFSSGFSEGLEMAAADSVPGIDTLAVLDGGARITAESDFTRRLARMDSLTKSGVPLDEALEEVKVEGEELQTIVLRQIQRLRMSDNATVIKYFIGNLSFAILLIQPVFAFILYLMYWRRRREIRFVGHLIFSLYSHSWALIMLTICLLLNYLMDGLSILTVMSFLIPIYLLLAKRYYYQSSWMRTIPVTLVALGGYLILIAPIFGIGSFLVSFYLF